MRRVLIREQSGFSMIEVLVAVLLYSIALASLFGFLVTSVTAGSIGESSAVAVNLARQRIEAISVLNFSTLPPDCVSPGNVTTKQVPANQGRVYTLTVNCNNQPKYVDVTVSVRWRAGTAPQQYTRTLKTRVAK